MLTSNSCDLCIGTTPHKPYINFDYSPLKLQRPQYVRFKSVPKGYSTKHYLLPLIAQDSYNHLTPIKHHRHFSQHIFSPANEPALSENSRSNSVSTFEKLSESLQLNTNSNISGNITKSFQQKESFEFKNKQNIQRGIFGPIKLRYSTAKLTNENTPTRRRKTESLEKYRSALKALLLKHSFERKNMASNSSDYLNNSDNYYPSKTKIIRISKFRRRSIPTQRPSANQKSLEFLEISARNNQNSFLKHDPTSPSFDETNVTSIAGVKQLPDYKKMIELRKERLSQIYNNVVHKEGISQARKILTTYFKETEGMIPLIKRPVIMKKLIKSHIKVIEQQVVPDPKIKELILKNTSPGKRTIVMKLSEIQKMERRKSYGKWYLKPTEYYGQINKK